MSTLRFIKLLTPTNDCISVEISGDEVQFMDLVSMVTGIPVLDIKGIRDFQGNYYTISSVLKNFHINSENSEIYYLVCTNIPAINYTINTHENYNIYNNHANINSNVCSNNPHPSIINERSFNYSDTNNNQRNQSIPNSEPNYNYYNYNQIGNLNYNDGNNKLNNTQQNYLRAIIQNPIYTNLNHINTNPAHINTNLNHFNTNPNHINTNYNYINTTNSSLKNTNPISNSNIINQNILKSNLSTDNLNTGLIHDSNRDSYNLDNGVNSNNGNLRPNSRVNYTNYHLSNNQPFYKNSRSNVNLAKLNLNTESYDFLDIPNAQNNISNTLNQMDQYEFRNNYFNNRNYNKTHTALHFRVPQLPTLFSPKLLENDSKNSNILTSKKRETNSIDIFLSIAQELNEKDYLDSNNIPRLCQLILKENDEVINLMRFYSQDIIDVRSLVSGLNKILNSYSQMRPSSPSNIKFKLRNLIDQLSYIFEDPNDFLLLRKFVEYGNDFIIGAYEVYESDKDISNFIESLKILIGSKRKKGPELNDEIKQLKIRDVLIPNEENEKYKHSTFININNMKRQNFEFKHQINESKHQSNEFIHPITEFKTQSNELKNQTTQFQNQNNEFKNQNNQFQNQNNEYKNQMNNFFAKRNSSAEDEISLYKQKSSTQSAKKYNLSKEVETNILSSLHTEERAIFKYSIKNKFQEVELLAQIWDSFQKDDILIKPVRLLCRKFINEFVIKNLSNIQKDMFNEMLASRNKSLISIFKEFNDHSNLSKLEKDITSYILESSGKFNKINDKSSPKEDSSSESDTLEEVDESNIKDRQRGDSPNQNPNNSIFQQEVCSTIAKNYNVDEFIQLVNIMKFLKPEEKKELENMVKSRKKNAMEVVEGYYKNKSIVNLKNSVLNLLRKRSIQSNNNSTFNSIESIRLSNINNTLINNQGSIQGQNTIIKTNEKKESRSSHQTISSRQSLTKNYSTLEQLLEDLEKSGKISSHQHKLLYQRYKCNDDGINSAWEFYIKTKDLADLVESLKVLASNANKTRKINPPAVTPDDLKSTKNEYIEFIKSKSNKKEKETVKIMQFNMIKILAKDNSVNKNSLLLFKEMILHENPLLISAFEVFGVSKDHKDFSNTLNVIANIFNPNSKNTDNSENKKENKIKLALVKNMNSIKNNQQDANDRKFLQLFEKFIAKKPILSPSDEEKLKMKIMNRDQYMMSSLELYEISQDDDELWETIKLCLKK